MVILPGKTKSIVEIECVIFNKDGTVKDREVAIKEYITETREVEK